MEDLHAEGVIQCAMMRHFFLWTSGGDVKIRDSSHGSSNAESFLILLNQPHISRISDFWLAERRIMFAVHL